MKAAFSPQAAKQRLFCRLEIVYGADAFDDFGGGADLGDDFLQGLVGHGGFVDGVLQFLRRLGRVIEPRIAAGTRPIFSISFVFHLP